VRLGPSWRASTAVAGRRVENGLSESSLHIIHLAFGKLDAAQWDQKLCPPDFSYL